MKYMQGRNPTATQIKSHQHRGKPAPGWKDKGKTTRKMNSPKGEHKTANNWLGATPTQNPLLGGTASTTGGRYAVTSSGQRQTWWGKLPLCTTVS